MTDNFETRNLLEGTSSRPWPREQSRLLADERALLLAGSAFPLNITAISSGGFHPVGFLAIPAAFWSYMTFLGYWQHSQNPSYATSIGIDPQGFLSASAIAAMIAIALVIGGVALGGSRSGAGSEPAGQAA